MTVGLNRAKMTTSTTGTGTITLGSAVTGYATLAEAGAVNATAYTYCIEDGDDFEIGTGTYTSSGTTLSRDTVTLSKISGTAGTSKINLSGSAKVFVTVQASDLVRFDGPLGTPSSGDLSNCTGVSFGFTYETAQATTSGSTKDFTGIPSGVEEIIIYFKGVSLAGTNSLLVQIGDSGGIETTGYSSGGSYQAGATTSTSGFVIFSGSAANTYSGPMCLSRVSTDGTEWVSSHVLFAGSEVVYGGGRKTLSAELTQVRLSANGSTFDAGAVNIKYR